MSLMHLYNNLEAYIAGEKAKLDELLKANLPEVGIISQVLVSPSGMTRKSHLVEYSVNKVVPYLEIDTSGIIGDRHHQSVRLSTGREKEILPKRSMVREHRHIFAVSLGDCEELSALLGYEATPQLLGANIVIEREDKRSYSLSALPQGTYLRITDSGQRNADKPIAVLQKYVTQEGCGITGNAISHSYGKGTELTKLFEDAAKLNRGIVCSVEFAGVDTARLEAGQKVFFGFPTGYAP